MAGELRVGLVNEDERARIVGGGQDRGVIEKVAGRIVRRGETDHVGVYSCDRVTHALRIELVGDPYAVFMDPHPGKPSEPRVHRVGRREDEERSIGSTKDEEGVEKHLVAAVPEDDLLGCHFPSSR